MENQNLNELNVRCMELIEYAQMPLSSFANKVGMQNSTLNHIVMGRNTPSVGIIQKILIAFPEISAEYLLIGRGELMKPNKKKDHGK